MPGGCYGNGKKALLGQHLLTVEERWSLWQV